MTTATQGRAREYLVRDYLAARGYPFIMRAAASKGAADLLHGHPDYGAVLIQVGAVNKSLNQDGRDRFVDAAVLCHALPVLASVVRGGANPVIKFWLVTRDVPSRWSEWTP